MGPKEIEEESRRSKDSKVSIKQKGVIHSKQYETLCLNQSEMRHVNSIRPYCGKERRGSGREHRLGQSPYDRSKSRSRRFENSSRKSEDGINKKHSDCYPENNRQMSNVLSELLKLKSQYKVLKGNYKKLISQKGEEVMGQQRERKKLEQQKKKLEEQLQRKIKQAQRYQKSSFHLEQELDRMKKQFYKILQLQRFKIKKFQETIQEKQLMIAYLRNEIQQLRKTSFSQNPPSDCTSLSFLQGNPSLISFDYFSKQISGAPNIQNWTRGQQNKDYLLEENSLSFSRDKSKELDSIINSFLSNTEQSFQQNANFQKKDNIPINSLHESPIEPQIEIIQEMSEISERELERIKIEKSVSNFQERLSEMPLQQKNKAKIMLKKLQINTDENENTSNTREEISMETKKKLPTSSNLFSCKQKKKATAKKTKPY